MVSPAPPPKQECTPAGKNAAVFLLIPIWLSGEALTMARKTKPEMHV